MRSWVIGSSADCDVVVDSPLASSRHCQLTQTADGFILDDLGSTNGTYVDGVRIASSTRVTPANEITLGQTVPMPWPAEVVNYITNRPRTRQRHHPRRPTGLQPSRPSDRRGGFPDLDRGPRFIQRDVH